MNELQQQADLQEKIDAFNGDLKAEQLHGCFSSHRLPPSNSPVNNLSGEKREE